MTMNNRTTLNRTEEKNRLMLAGETSFSDKGVFVCDLLLLGVFIWNQFIYKMDMILLIIPLLLIAIWIAVFALTPENYCFTDSSLEITHKFRKTLQISYENVFNYDASTRDKFLNILQKNEVKVYYYTATGNKRAVLCSPKNVGAFIEMLWEKCPEFYDEEHNNLQVFFDHLSNKGE